MKIWIVQTGEPMFTDGTDTRPMRAMNLASKAIEEGHEITIITANFNHFTKTKRFKEDNVLAINKSMSIVFVDSPGYKRNISPQRFIDHFILGSRMSKISKKLPLPDSVFIGYPPIETSWFMSRFLKKRRIPYILDVKDAWPSNIVDAFPKKLRLTAKLLLIPYFLMFQSTARNARKLCSISETFLYWAQETAKRKGIGNDFVAPLTSRELQIPNNELFEAENWFSNQVVLDKDKPTIYFIGSLSRSFDFEPAIKLANDNKVNLLIGGDGEQLEFLQNQTDGLRNVIFLGWVNYAQSQVISMNSDFALAPLKPLADFEMSVPNKYYDYMRQGKPILSSLNGDSRKLIEENGVGCYYYDSKSLENLLNSMSHEMIAEMSTKSRKLYEDKFLFDKVYGKLVSELLV